MSIKDSAGVSWQSDKGRENEEVACGDYVLLCMCIINVSPCTGAYLDQSPRLSQLLCGHKMKDTAISVKIES
jgi:hypothetical protein